jgi:FO synthase
MHAVARLVFHKHILNIQASWLKLGLSGLEICLNAGVNDIGGSLMNETITRAAGAVHGQEMIPENLVSTIRSIGREPRQRATLYGTPELHKGFNAEPVKMALSE